jgi:hypothetical protein
VWKGKLYLRDKCVQVYLGRLYSMRNFINYSAVQDYQTKEDEIGEVCSRHRRQPHAKI